MKLKTRLAGKTYQFDTIKEVLAKANEAKSGDILAGIAAENDTERIAAKIILSEMKLHDLRENPVVPYEMDDVTRIIQDNIDENVYSSLKNMTVGELREKLLNADSSEKIKRIGRGLSSEMIAGAAKVMSNLDLIYAASKIRNEVHCNTSIGTPGTFSSRLQPNHTVDGIDGITASVFEGLSYGVGDAVIGLNPVNDTVSSLSEVLKRFDEIKQRLKIPTQQCVLGHITTQIEAVKQGAPSDLIFQSIAGSQKGNETFGFSTEDIEEAKQILAERGTGKGPNLLYFETGQGSELSSGSHFDADQVTMEARCYGYARVFEPFLVNTVVGFIGPEYLYNSKQVIRAGLEDHFMGKLSGLPMGCDCCYTNHMMADQNDIENLTVLLASAGCTYVIGVAGSDDVMLNYQSNSFHDIAAIREVLNLRPAKEFEEWLEKMGVMENGKLTELAGNPVIFAEKYRRKI